MKIVVAVFILLAPIAFAQTTLRWGADTESGVPFSYTNPQNPNELIGFEAEIAEALGEQMGLKAEHIQNQWDGLIQGLERNDYDIVINGLEITPDRAQVVAFSKPYFVTSEALTVRATTFDINSLADLKGRRVGTLDGSLALRILQTDAPEAESVLYDEEVHAYNDLANGRLDAVLLDFPIAQYYAIPRPELKTLSLPIGRMEYGIAMRKQDTQLHAQVNRALEEMIRSGRMRQILERWNLWNIQTAKEWNESPEATSPPVAFENYLKTSNQKRDIWQRIKQYAGFLPLLGKGALLTLGISIVSMALAVFVGLIVALGRQFGPKIAVSLATAYVEVFRGTPLLIQLYLIFYGLPHIGLKLDPFLAAVLGLGLNYGACEAENYRAGLLSVPKSQMDAAQALGMSRAQALRYVLVPQAMRLVLPPVTNDFIALLKDSSLVSVITMVELTTIYGQLASTYFDYLGIGILVAGVYFVIGLPFVRLSRYYESRLARDQSRMPSKPVT